MSIQFLRSQVSQSVHCVVVVIVVVVIVVV